MMLANISLLTPLTVPVVLGLVLALLLGFGLLRTIGGSPAAASRKWSLWGLRWAAVATLALILLNPSNVSQSPGPIDRPDVFYLLDASQSMAVGDRETRFDHALRLMREAQSRTDPEASAEVRLFRFGHRLAAVEDLSPVGLAEQKPPPPSSSWSREVHASESATAKSLPLSPTDSDTQLLTALRQVSSRFGRRPPAAIVLFSDGRAREDSGVEPLGEQFSRLNIPVHVVPVGDNARGGDVSIVACVVPARVRRFTEVEVQVFLRSYGYEGRRCEIALTSPAGPGEEDGDRLLAPPLPVTLHDGFQSVGLSFRSDARTRRLRVAYMGAKLGSATTTSCPVPLGSAPPTLSRWRIR